MASDAADSEPAADPQQAAPQLYLVTPVGALASTLAPLLGEVLDRVEVACIRIRAGDDLAELGRLADTVRDLAHGRDIPVVVDDHWPLVASHGLDGVHLTSGARRVRDARRDLGADAIVGAFCGVSRHLAMSAAEAGADYVSFGPVGGPAPASAPELAPLDLFAWWSEMIEVPVVAEGGLDAELIGKLAPITDFIALGPEIWIADDPAQALSSLWR